MTVDATPCVICGSAATTEAFSIRPSVSTDRQVIDSSVRNRFCDACGTVWNAGGARIDVPKFYAESYDLHGNSALSEFQVHVEGGARGESDAILEFIEGSAFPENGRILEIGCGKGLLLGKFLRNHPGWNACAVEPSLHATEYFKKILPDVRIHEGPFETAPFRHEIFDFVAVSGVLEHVPDPVDFLTIVSSTLRTGGRLYVGVPNFAAKPDDLAVFDHLTRFTPDTLDQLYSRTGFVLSRRDANLQRVWLWDFLIRAEEPLDIPDSGVAGARALLSSHIETVENSLRSFERMIEEAIRGEKLAIYGLGVLGLLARDRAGDRAEAVRFLLDDNALLWGSSKEGLEIRGSRSIPELGIQRVFIAANPCYHDRMRNNLIAQGIRVEHIYA